MGDRAKRLSKDLVYADAFAASFRV